MIERLVDPAPERFFEIRKVERHPELVKSVVFPPNLDDDSRVVSVQSPTTTFVTKKTMSVRERELARN